MFSDSPVRLHLRAALHFKLPLRCSVTYTHTSIMSCFILYLMLQVESSVCGSRHCCWKQRACAPPCSAPRRLASVGRWQGGGYCRQLPGSRAEARAVPQQHKGIGGPRTSWRGCRARGKKQFRRGSRGQGSRLQQQHNKCNTSNTSNTNMDRRLPGLHRSGCRWVQHSDDADEGSPHGCASTPISKPWLKPKPCRLPFCAGATL